MEDSHRESQLASYKRGTYHTGTWARCVFYNFTRINSRIQIINQLINRPQSHSKIAARVRSLFKCEACFPSFDKSNSDERISSLACGVYDDNAVGGAVELVGSTVILANLDLRKKEKTGTRITLIAITIRK